MRRKYYIPQVDLGWLKTFLSGTEYNTLPEKVIVIFWKVLASVTTWLADYLSQFNQFCYSQCIAWVRKGWQRKWAIQREKTKIEAGE